MRSFRLAASSAAIALVAVFAASGAQAGDTAAAGTDSGHGWSWIAAGWSW